MCLASNERKAVEIILLHLKDLEGSVSLALLKTLDFQNCTNKP